MHRLRLGARHDAQGDIRVTWLLRDGDRLALWDEGEAEALVLPPGAIGAVLTRYGRPLEEGAAGAAGGSDGPLELPQPEEGALRAFRFTPWGYLQPLDYLALERPGAEPLAAAAPLVVAALRSLGRAAISP